MWRSYAVKGWVLPMLGPMGLRVGLVPATPPLTAPLCMAEMILSGRRASFLEFDSASGGSNKGLSQSRFSEDSLCLGLRTYTTRQAE